MDVHNGTNDYGGGFQCFLVSARPLDETRVPDYNVREPDGKCVECGGKRGSSFPRSDFGQRNLPLLDIRAEGFENTFKVIFIFLLKLV